jgi:glycerol uptake facilitator-like aquaporin
VVQVIGATLAGFFAAALLHDQGQIVQFGAPRISPDISLASGILLEATFTFFLVWTIVATAVNPDGPKEWAPIAIATALGLGVFISGALTGGSFNPARAFGPDLTNAIFGDHGGFGNLGDFLLAYVVGPIAGGVIAATLYNALYIKEKAPAAPAPSEQSPL